MRFPSELRTEPVNPSWNNWRTDLLFPRFDVAGPRNRRSDNGGTPPGYYQEGFLAIQNAIAAQFLQMKSSTAAQMPDIYIQVTMFIFPSGLTFFTLFSFLLAIPLPTFSERRFTVRIRDFSFFHYFTKLRVRIRILISKFISLRVLISFFE